MHKNRNEARRFLVVTDGTLTETTYFERLNRLSSDVIIVKRTRHFNDLVPKTRQVRNDGNFDQAFIVCDIDEHCKNAKSRIAFEAMITLAKKEGIEVACSHEAFETWILAHKCQVPAEAKDRKIAQTLAKQYGLLMGRNNKVIVDSEITKESILKASQEAKRLRKVYGDNVLADGPTTDVDQIADQIHLP